MGALCSGALIPPAFGHHSFAATFLPTYDFRLEGDVVLFMYRNPHSLLQLSVRGADGKEEKWAVEWGATFDLKNTGVAQDALKFGDHVIVMGARARNPSDKRVRLRSIERPKDGWKWSGDFK